MAEHPEYEEMEFSISLENMEEQTMQALRLIVVLVKDHLTAFHHPLMVQVVESGLLPVQEMLGLYCKLHRHTDEAPETLSEADILLMYASADICGKLMVSSLGDQFLAAWQIRHTLDKEEADLLRSGLTIHIQDLVAFFNSEMQESPAFIRLQQTLINDFHPDLLD